MDLLVGNALKLLHHHRSESSWLWSASELLRLETKTSTCQKLVFVMHGINLADLHRWFSGFISCHQRNFAIQNILYQKLAILALCPLDIRLYKLLFFILCWLLPCRLRFVILSLHCNLVLISFTLLISKTCTDLQSHDISIHSFYHVLSECTNVI